MVVGAGPGIGAAMARRFAKAGLPVCLIARSPATLEEVARTLEPYGTPTLCLPANSADETSLRAALDAAVTRFGVPQLVVYNAAIIRRDMPGELSATEHAAAWAVNVVGAITTATHFAPAMARHAGGSVLLTGGMPEPDPQYTSLSLGKAALRALASLLAEHYEASGVHVATVTVAGAVAPGTAFDPDDIAENYWRLHTQRPAEWQTEVVHG